MLPRLENKLSAESKSVLEKDKISSKRQKRKLLKRLTIKISYVKLSLKNLNNCDEQEYQKSTQLRLCEEHWTMDKNHLETHNLSPLYFLHTYIQPNKLLLTTSYFAYLQLDGVVGIREVQFLAQKRV